MTVIKPVNELFGDAADSRNYSVIKKSAQYDGGAANDLNKMTKKIVVQLED